MCGAMKLFLPSNLRTIKRGMAYVLSRKRAAFELLVLIVILIAVRLNAERFNIDEILCEHNNRDAHRRI